MRLAAGALAAAALALLIVVGRSGGHPGHRIAVTLPSAADVVAGQEVRAAGQPVGSVDSVTAVDGGRAARLELTIDDAAWPLSRGTTMALRWGGTVSFVNRYIALRRGPAGGPAMATGGVFPASAFTVPVEFDQFLGTFDGRTRASLRALLDRAGLNLRAAGPALAAALRAAPPALGQASYLLRDLDSSETELDTLVRAGSAVTGSVQASDPGLGALITSAASTFDALAARAGRLEASLRLAPATLAQARATLARAQPTLRLAGTVTGRLAPGVRQVQAIARPVSHLLVTLERVGPDAVGALAAAHSATPALNPLLARLATTMPALRTIGSLGTTELSCIRPYTPDIVAFASDWGDFLSGVDGKDHYFRAQIQALLPALHNAQTIDSAQLKRQFPWISFAFPAPPGYAAGQPWLLPRCGEGASTLDPSQDPENDATAAELPPAPGGAR